MRIEASKRRLVGTKPLERHQRVLPPGGQRRRPCRRPYGPYAPHAQRRGGPGSAESAQGAEARGVEETQKERMGRSGILLVDLLYIMKNDLQHVHL